MNKSLCFLLTFRNKPFAVKSVKTFKSFGETSLISVKENFLARRTLGDMSCFSYKKLRIPKAKSAASQYILSKKLQMYSWMWKSKDKFSIIKKRFVIYFRAFTENIINSRKLFFSKNITAWLLSNSNWGIIAAIVSHPVMIGLC